MSPSPSKKDEYKKIYTKARPNLLKLAKELYIADISDNFFLEVVIPLSDYLNSFKGDRKRVFQKFDTSFTKGWNFIKIFPWRFSAILDGQSPYHHQI